MAGPLFRQLAEGLSKYYSDGITLITGDPDTLRIRDTFNPLIQIIPAPSYNRISRYHRAISWIKYVLSITPLNKSFLSK